MTDEMKTIEEHLEEYASRAGFDYVDNIVQEHPDHRFNDHDVEFAYRDGIIVGAEWQKEQDTREMIMSDGSYFQKCYELGKKDMKEQMMKDLSEKIAAAYQLGLADKEKQMMKGAVECETVCLKDRLLAVLPIKEFQWTAGDKIKIIIVKEDNNE